MCPGDAQLAAVCGSFLGDVPPAELDAARVRRERSGEDAEQRRLAGPVWPDDTHGLAMLQGQVDAIEHGERAEALPDVDRGEDRRLAHYPAA